MIKKKKRLNRFAKITLLLTVLAILGGIIFFYFIPTPAIPPQKAEKLLKKDRINPTVASKKPIATPSPTLLPPPTAYSIDNPAQEFQTWNNCGPATVTMLLRTLKLDAMQDDIAYQLKPNPDDKNVSPKEIEGFLQKHQTLNAIYRINGDLDLLKRLISKEIPVIVEIWFEREENDGLGHYQILHSYNDNQTQFLANDSYQGSNTVEPYAQFDENWKVYNRTYIIAYKDNQEKTVKNIIGEDWKDKKMLLNAKLNAEKEINKNEKDAFAWYNLATVLSKQNKHAEAVIAFDKARSIGLPWRMLWYQFAIFDSYLAEERYQDVLNLTAKNLEQSKDLEESYYYRAKALEKTGQEEEAKELYQKVLDLNPNSRFYLDLPI
jgi:hypothetical protein